jgi:hypothetical protein
LVGKAEGERPLGRPSRRWEDNIEMNLEETGCGSVWTASICPVTDSYEHGEEEKTFELRERRRGMS